MSKNLNELELKIVGYNQTREVTEARDENGTVTKLVAGPYGPVTVILQLENGFTFQATMSDEDCNRYLLPLLD